MAARSEKSQRAASTVLRDRGHPERVRLGRGPDGGWWLDDGQGSRLALTEGADGLYFSREDPAAGAPILPGWARNWCEGRIHLEDGMLVVHGVQLEKGLALFILPFEDVSPWFLRLERVDGSGERRGPCVDDGEQRVP